MKVISIVIFFFYALIVDYLDHLWKYIKRMVSWDIMLDYCLALLEMLLY